MAAESNREKTDLVKEFCLVTGVDQQRAQLYLEASGWEINLATANFYEDTDEGMASEPAPFAIEASPPLSTTDSSAAVPPSTPATRFATLSSILKEDDSDDEGQAFYAGGSERSGQQVLGPGKKKKDKSELVSEMFKAAKEHGAHILEPNDTPTKRGSGAFGGQGYKLGSDNDSSVVVPNSVPTSDAERSVEMSLKMWKNGFSIDDGPLREYSDPRNIVFLESIKKGEIPPELYQQARGEVNLNMEDHQHQEYQPPRSKYSTFAGEGHRLGNPAPAVTQTSFGLASATDASSNEANEVKARLLLKTDEEQPTSSIQIRLADGSRLIVKVNLSHTVGDIRRYLVTARPQFENTVFSLLTTFPNKELTDDKSSIKDANLVNAVIVQKIN